MHREAPFFLIAHSVVFMPMRKNVIGYKMSPLGDHRFDHGGSAVAAAPCARPMLRFLLRRVTLIVPTFVGVTLLSFLLIHLVPGRPDRGAHGRARHRRPSGSPRLRHAVRPRPAAVAAVPRTTSRRCCTAISAPRSSRSEPVWHEFLALFPATVELSVCAILFALVVGLPLGVIAAVRRGSAFDYGLMGMSRHRRLHADLLVGADADPGVLRRARLDAGVGPHQRRVSTSQPWTGFMLIDCWFSDDAGALRSASQHLILPTIVLGTIPLAVIARMTRSAMLEVLREDYIRTARAKGLARAARRRRARAAQRADPGGHGDRPAGRHAARRRHPDRDDLLLARRRPLAGREHPAARLSGAAGRHAAGRDAWSCWSISASI